MAEYRVEIKHPAEGDLENLDPNSGRRILLSIGPLASDPRPRQSRKLVGSEDSCRLRVGRYQELYQIDDESRLITVFAISHRREMYR